MNNFIKNYLPIVGIFGNINTCIINLPIIVNCFKDNDFSTVNTSTQIAILCEGLSWFSYSLFDLDYPLMSCNLIVSLTSILLILGKCLVHKQTGNDKKKLKTKKVYVLPQVLR